MRSCLLASVALLALLFLLPATASAATASVVDGVLVYGDGTARVEVSLAGTPTAVVLADRVSPPVAGTGCAASGEGQVTCDVPVGGHVRIVGSAQADVVDVSSASVVPRFDAGDGSDTLTFERAELGVNVPAAGLVGVETVVGSVHADVLAAAVRNIFANEGNDLVRSASLDQVVDLGAGDDVFVEQSAAKHGQVVSGGPGRDRYEATGTRREAFEICLDDRAVICGATDGRKFERDKVGSDIEDVRMRGHSEDLLIGSDVANTLDGGGGNDILTGGRGADTIRGGAGLDVVTYGISALDPKGVQVSLDGRRNDGNPRQDLVARDVEIVSGTRRNDRLVGGPGLDALFGEAGDDVLIGGKGPDLLAGGAGRDYIDARDGAKDELECGPGTDRIRADLFDTIHRDCEFRRFT